MIKAVRQSEENYLREQEQARARDEQLRSVRQTDRSGLTYFMPANSTPIRNDNTRSDTKGVYFNTNPMRHVYSTASDGHNHYEPLENDSIIENTPHTQANQPTSSTTGPTSHDTLWRHINNMGMTTVTSTHRSMTVPTGHNVLRKNISPNSSDNRNGPICFRCGEQGHIRSNCNERVFCDHCKSFNHSSRACRKQPNNTPSPAAGSRITTGYHPTATPPPLTNTQPPSAHNNQLFHNLFENNLPRTSTMIQTP